jgi:hypothetical protein
MYLLENLSCYTLSDVAARDPAVHRAILHCAGSSNEKVVDRAIACITNLAFYKKNRELLANDNDIVSLLLGKLDNPLSWKALVYMCIMDDQPDPVPSPERARGPTTSPLADEKWLKYMVGLPIMHFFCMRQFRHHAKVRTRPAREHPPRLLPAARSERRGGLQQTCAGAWSE